MGMWIGCGCSSSSSGLSDVPTPVEVTSSGMVDSRPGVDPQNIHPMITCEGPVLIPGVHILRPHHHRYWDPPGSVGADAPPTPSTAPWFFAPPGFELALRGFNADH
ncbi:hypothetical protein Syun_004414 [Stephania yunnanensis]|uniref:Uncharacterized protein n=1 Tax=Stephania yunnanensis TaxID=152371 RepID=A0AAP0L303_9MAGN